jgi:hypothetical protein
MVSLVLTLYLEVLLRQGVVTGAIPAFRGVREVVQIMAHPNLSQQLVVLEILHQLHLHKEIMAAAD